MSIHPSLRGADTLRGDRSVLSRFERITKLAKEQKLDPESDSAWGLPKVRTKFKVSGAKKKKAEGEGEEGAEGAEGAEEKAEESSSSEAS